MIDEALIRSHGAIDLMLGRRDEGWRRLDTSADGFWNSFLAIPITAPALLVIFLSYARLLVEAGIEMSVGGIVSILALIGVVNWLASVLVIVLLARPLGVGHRTSHLVVAVNWASVAIAYARAVPASLTLLVGNGPTLATLMVVIEVVTLVLYWRVLSAASEASPLVPTVMFVVTITLGYALTVAMQTSLGLSPPTL